VRADRAVEVASNGTRYPLRTNARHRGPLSGDLQPKLERTDWDPVIVDESHKAHLYGHEVDKTGPYELGELLGRVTRHLFLMTAHPAQGRPRTSSLSWR
jgi:hypothetical protein